MSKEKKKTIILTVVLGVICLGLIGFLIVDTMKQKGTMISKETKELMSNFDKTLNSKKKKVIYYASTGCGFCELQRPVLETIAEDYNMEYFEIDAATLGVKQKNEVLEKLEIEHATPTTLIVQNGKVLDKTVGYTDGREYVEFFSKNGIIPEDSVYSKDNNLTFINYEEYEELIEGAGINVVVVGQTTCSHCIAIKPALNDISGEYDVKINYLNLTEMTSEEREDFSESLRDIEYNEPDFVEKGEFGTPLTLIIEDSKVKKYISGERTKSQLVREFKKSGLINE